MKKKNIEKAIPGGKYGCVLLLKYYFPNEFQNVTFGKMIAIIKQSLTECEFCHYKTLIY